MHADEVVLAWILCAFTLFTARFVISFVKIYLGLNVLLLCIPVAVRSSLLFSVANIRFINLLFLIKWGLHFGTSGYYIPVFICE